MTVVTSKISPVTLGQGRDKETIYTATRTTKLGDGTYSVELLQYSDAKGAGGRVIAERESVNKWNFNDQASTKAKSNQGRLNEASKNQMESMRGDFVTKSQEAEEYNRAQGEPNKATNDNDNAESKPSNEMGSVASAGGTAISYGNYRYPIDIATSKQDVIKFDIYEYIPQEFSTSSGGGVYASNARRNAGGRKSIGSVILPIPAGIQDAKTVKWGEGEMNAMDIAKADIALTGIMDGIKPGLDKVGDYANVIKNNPDDAKKAIAAYFAGQASGKGQQVLQRTTGMVMNPNMELLFGGPSLRTFSFVFFLSPRSKDEAMQVKKIIRTFKQSMSPIRSKSNLFLKSPNTYGLRYLHRGEDGGLHKGLNAFKECAMTGFSVDYTPTGNYATYSDGTPVQYQISMSFNELEPIFNDEYDEQENEYIGF